MPREGNRRRKTPRLFDIIVVPLAEGRAPWKFRAGVTRLIAAVVLIFLVSVVLTLAVLVYTPVTMYLPIPNPLLEQKYGQQIAETQDQLRNLSQDVLLLKDYNQQLRKALGEGSSGDTSTTRGLTPSLMLEAGGDRPQPVVHAQAAPSDVSTGDAGLEEGFAGGTLTMISASEEVHAVFPLLPPSDGFVTQEFEPARHHYGMDFAGKRGSPVCAATDGRVVFSGWTYDDGNMLILSHGGGYLTVYKHNQTLLKAVQAPVRRGEPIALLGTSGQTSLGPHLHFEVWKDGVPQDPNDYLLTSSRVH